jgi:hypothetical protein|tara:strand:- start:1691 stop:1879 length:189 start_codon:yes stop_codon:yes gene_type:complete
MNILWDNEHSKKLGEVRVNELIEFLKDGFLPYDTMLVEKEFWDKDGTVYTVAKVLLEMEEPI